MRDFRELKVWQKSHRLALQVYEATRLFPKEEIYGLTSQIRRCSTCFPSYIAEGCGSGCELDMARFFQFTMGSACELEYHLLLLLKADC
jgi:four helix bundle protein